MVGAVPVAGRRLSRPPGGGGRGSGRPASHLAPTLTSRGGQGSTATTITLTLSWPPRARAARDQRRGDVDGAASTVADHGDELRTGVEPGVDPVPQAVGAQHEQSGVLAAVNEVTAGSSAGRSAPSQRDRMGATVGHRLDRRHRARLDLMLRPGVVLRQPEDAVGGHPGGAAVTGPADGDRAVVDEGRHRRARRRVAAALVGPRQRGDTLAGLVQGVGHLPERITARRVERSPGGRRGDLGGDLGAGGRRHPVAHHGDQPVPARAARWTASSFRDRTWPTSEIAPPRPTSISTWWRAASR